MSCCNSVTQLQCMLECSSAATPPAPTYAMLGAVADAPSAEGVDRGSGVAAGAGGGVTGAWACLTDARSIA